MILKEKTVERHIRKYLEKSGWKTTNLPKGIGEHGIDIKAYHPKWRKIYLIEVKGEGQSSKAQVMHAAFYNLLGQIISRMDKQGNDSQKARYYAIGIPKKWEKTFKNKISKMKYGWGLLKLKVFLVGEDGTVEEKTHTYFYK
jgi:hypothetical protein